MKRLLSFCFFSLIAATAALAQINQITDDGDISRVGSRSAQRDTVGKGNKEIPKGLKVWTVDEMFGERMEAQPDTMQHLFMNTIFTNGKYGEYSTLGNLGAPRFNRIFTDGRRNDEFIFTSPYDYFLTPVGDFHFTNTLSPITNLNYNTCGSGTDGEDHLKVLFATNAGKDLGFGMKFDYLYGKGYYQNNNTAHFDYSFWGSYTGDRYQAHLLVSLNHQKTAENGGVTNDEYILHPESFSDNYTEKEIPVVLSDNWNRNDNQHIFFSHRYNVGFQRKVPMTKEEIEAKKFAMQSQKDNAEKNAIKRAIEKEKKAKGEDFDEEEFREELKRNPSLLDEFKKEAAVDTSWTKKEYVPVTSFIHTAKLDNYRRIYQAYNTPKNYYLNRYYDCTAIDNGGRIYQGDSIYDMTKHLSLKNTFAIGMLEGFNKWVPMGLKLFAAHELRKYSLPDVGEPDKATGLLVPVMKTYTENDISIGGQLQKTLGKALHYNVTLETWLAGASVGEFELKGDGDVNVPVLGDTVSLKLNAALSSVTPSFYYDTFHSKYLWWDNELKKQTNIHLEGMLELPRFGSQIRLAVDEIKDYVYLVNRYDITSGFGREGNTVEVRQSNDMITLLTLQLQQRLKLGPLNFETQLTYQKSSHQSIMPLPDLNVYANLYLKFRIAKVLSTELGADVRYFTEYEAPEYVPLLGQFCVQDNGSNNVKVGNYPIVNVYANFHLKHARFFVMMSHVNASAGNYFTTPHYPQNTSLFRFGVSWNFFN